MVVNFLHKEFCLFIGNILSVVVCLFLFLFAFFFLLTGSPVSSPPPQSSVAAGFQKSRGP